MPTDLKHFNVTIVRFNPSEGVGSGEPFTLPVHSPDVEHAISSTMANCVSFSTKSDGSDPLPVAFTCIGVTEERGHSEPNPLP